MPDNSPPLFSIITVTYNASSTIAHTLASVDEQLFKSYEHLIIDGLSSDSTLEIVKQYPSPLRTVISEADRGIYDAMNKGISIAKGQYLIFLNSGDTFHTSDTLGTLARAIEQNNTPGIVYGQTQLVNPNRERVADRHLTAPDVLTYKSFANGMVVCHQAFVALRRIVPLYDLRYKYSADYDWCIQCLQHSRHNVLVPEILIDYLDEGVTTANHKASLKERFKIMCYYYGTFNTILHHLSFIPRYVKRKAARLKQ
ncbi:MAG: glycosyltransferase [Firmicutes bacterium]|nr:glycosyltransferase [Bacillota bacterium]MCM1477708.1 glycosyltransferase [Bacteroides sp.]